MIEFSPRPTSTGLEYQVRTRSLQTVEDTVQYIYGEAAARVELVGGLCFVGGGTGLGLDLNGS